VLDDRAQLHVGRHLQDHRQRQPQMLGAVHHRLVLGDHLRVAADHQRHGALARDEAGRSHGRIKQQAADLITSTLVLTAV